MSYESDAMLGLKNAIRDEMPSLKNAIRDMNKGNKELANALNDNTRSQNISSLIRLCEISMQKPELNLFTTAETVEILRTIKGEIVGKEQVKEKTKKISFFR